MQTPEEIKGLVLSLKESLQAFHPEIPTWDQRLKQDFLELCGLLNEHRSEFAEGDGEKFVCPHGPSEEPLTVIVLGVECRFAKSPYCQTCTATYLNRYSTLCGLCNRPIFPGDPIEVSGRRDGEYVHSRCGDCAAAYAGHWGEGKLIPFVVH